MDLKSKDGQLVRSALGRVGFIGELYNARTERFSSRSLFQASFPSNLVLSQDTRRTEFDYSFTESVSDRFDLLKVEADLQVTLLCGIVEARGSGKFLTHEKKSEKSVSCSLICKLHTVCDKLYTCFGEMCRYVDMSALSDLDNTHVVVEINWGANFLCTLEKTYSFDSQKKEIEGALKGELNTLVGLIKTKAVGELETRGSRLDEKNNFKVKVCADIVPEDEWPTSFESFCRFLSEIPRLVMKTNNGKGTPLNYTMIPLSVIRKMAKVEISFETVVKSIDESFLMSTVFLFEEIFALKQKFHDLVKEMKDHQEYLSDEALAKTKKQHQELMMKESELKLMIAEDWVAVRSGSKNLRDLIRRTEKFKAHELRLSAREEFLDSCCSIRSKIKTVKNYISFGVDYLGKNNKFSDILNSNVSFDFIVLVVSSEFEGNDPDHHQKECYYFLTLAKEKKPNTKYVVVDLDLDNDANDYTGTIRRNRAFFSKFKLTRARCFHMKGAKILSTDLYQDYLAEQERNFARLREGFEMEYIHHKPSCRVILEMTCPGSQSRSCTLDKVKWNCFQCKTNIEYGFDEYFYCACGKAASNSFEYRCSDDKHGCFFVSAKSNFLQGELSNLRPVKELNILILGQSGVGKSTWINSIVNYLNYDTMEKAKEGKVICTIPAKLTMYDQKTLKKHVIEIGEKTDEEDTETGKSATQSAHTYTFLWMETYVRLIDTPGLGDHRGIEQDKQNMKNIIDHISNLKEINGICILMKANDNRLNAIFSYCIQELLVHLHKSVAKNIVFCFTNSRISFYTPGQTSAMLETLIDNLGIRKELAMGPHNRFCIDNEAFLFLCFLGHPEIHFEEHLVASFAQSWEISLKETKRLFETIRGFRPHVLNETLSLVTARSRILSLMKPLAEISKTIQMNLTAISNRKKEIETSDKTLKELLKKLYVDEIHMTSQKLDYPKTVCTNPSCVEYHRYEGDLDVKEIEYKTICHDHCYIKNVEPTTVNNIDLKGCWAMSNGICKVCKCPWQAHMHITFNQARVIKKGVNKKVEGDIKKEKSDKERIEQFVQDLEKKTDKYKIEQDFIIQTAVKFGMFLKDNAIYIYNDAIADYLKYLIEQEEIKPHKTETEEKLLMNMKETLKQYKAEIEILQKVIDESENQSGHLTVQDVYRLEQELYDLEIFGPEIKKAAEMSRTSSKMAYSYIETPLQIPHVYGSRFVSAKQPQQVKKKGWFSK